MNKPIIRVADVDREMTDEEYAVYLQDQENYKNEQKAKEEKLAKKQAALNKLIDLGLTEEEVKAFLG